MADNKNKGRSGIPLARDFGIKTKSLNSVPISRDLGVKTRSLYSNPVTTVSGAKLNSLYSDEIKAPLPSSETGEFSVRRGYEGLQIVINWPNPDVGCDTIRILRKLYDWPSSINDGVIVFSQEEPFEVFNYSDRGVKAYQMYYYVMFMRRLDGTWYTKRTLRGKIFPLPTAYFETALWNRLPGVYHRLDGES